MVSLPPPIHLSLWVKNGDDFVRVTRVTDAHMDVQREAIDITGFDQQGDWKPNPARTRWKVLRMWMTLGLWRAPRAFLWHARPLNRSYMPGLRSGTVNFTVQIQTQEECDRIYRSLGEIAQVRIDEVPAAFVIITDISGGNYGPMGMELGITGLITAPPVYEDDQSLTATQEGNAP